MVSIAQVCQLQLLQKVAKEFKDDPDCVKHANEKINKKKEEEKKIKKKIKKVKKMIKKMIKRKRHL